MRWSFIWLVLSLCSCSVVESLDSYGDSMDSVLQDSAFRALVRHRPHTGAVYKAILPANLSGMDVSIVRLRSRRLWRIGANFSDFHIPPRTGPVPYVRRLAIVYQDLGNWSSCYYTVPGYSFITSVVGFMVFDVSDIRAKSIRKINLSTTREPISIHFSGTTLTSTARCVAFSSNSTFQLSRVSFSNACHASSQGHFAIVLPLKRNQSFWYLWATGFLLALGGLISIAYLGIVVVRVLTSKKIQVMEREADEGEVFDSRWIRSSKMPFATVTRTQPVLEDGGFP